jgi:hypothetical protein
MDLVNERVEHINFGIGVVTEVNDDKIAIQFQDEIGTKLFPYPEAFGRFLKAVNPAVQDNVMDEYLRKQEQLELERERMEKEREAAELEEKKAKLQLAKEKAARSRKKKLQK